MVGRRRWFGIGSVVALALAGVAAFAALLVALGGVGGATGMSRWEALGPVSFEPTWSVVGGTDAHEVRLQFFRAGEVDGVEREYLAEVQPGDISLDGRAVLRAAPGWSGLMFSVFMMAAIGVLVLAALLALVGLLLRSAARGEPFTAVTVRRTRQIGWLLVGWQVAQPVAWLFFSPKAFDISEVSRSQNGMSLLLGDQEPGGPSLAVLALGGLVLLLAEVFAYGARLADEHRLTV